jgi:hypothetical protein
VGTYKIEKGAKGEKSLWPEVVSGVLEWKPCVQSDRKTRSESLFHAGPYDAQIFRVVPSQKEKPGAVEIISSFTSMA